MPDLLIELFCEEIPARMQARAAADLEKAVNDRLLAGGYMPEGVKAFATPRRLALVAGGLPIAQPDRREERKGPRVGAPEKAIEGFLRGAGVTSLDKCETREDKKGQYYVAVIEEKGRATAEVIADMVPEIISGFPWPKSMRWGDGELKWVRPLHHILCVFDGEPVTFDFAGLPVGDTTYGHRFLAPEAIQTRNFEDYAARLKSAKVILDRDERVDLIAGEAKTLCEAQGLALVEDNALLGEVAGLAEWPVPMIGTYDEKFLALPDEVLTATMRGHQKYFSVCDPATGKLANKFIFVANIEAPDGGAAMRAGYERVLTARLSDAWYLYHQDLKTPLEERVSDLDRITFFEGLGTVGDKVRRIAALAREIAPAVGAEPDAAQKASNLAKSDLVTGMVYEFPELQGLMGRYYAAAQGVEANVADAICDHYKPQGQDDEIPTAPVSIAVALADKIDTLTAFWAIGKKPTGSSDPFALRRAALGVIQIVLENKLRLKLRKFGAPQASLASSWLAQGAKEAKDAKDGTPSDIESVLADRLSFFHDRLKVYLRDQAFRHDQIDAVLRDPQGALEDDIVLVVEKLKALSEFLTSDDGANLAAGYKRAVNILKAEEKKDGAPVGDSVNPEALKASEEKALFEALTKAQSDADASLAKEDFAAAMKALAGLRAPIDGFFEGVIVNDEDPGLRANRLALLARFRKATSLAADFSKLQGD